ncbi:hypothetical protein TOPH_06502 [Tolypocladium ophioglossoides CBS 100239]|uniref:Uncharacterized protein n=1 Tax=Tolypocladium ophioglossoides (strain CBS 100239) TaxID=1163406 RepID=A0A0L0N4B0_TOLOC|nr:hypothetical protein TOPH_06502 [Tolypocladium ophioglossoides CBS 100239]
MPSVRLMQDIVCKRFYGVDRDGLLAEEQYRGEGVQRALNSLSVEISIAMTPPAGARPGLSILGLLLSKGYAMYVCWQWRTMPAEAIWGMGAPLLIGGGPSVAEAMVSTIMEDVVPDSKRVTWFQYVVGAVLSSQLVRPALAGHLIKSSNRFPLWVSMSLIFAGGIAIVLFMPETLPNKDPTHGAVRSWRAGASPKTALEALFSRPVIYLVPGALLTIPVASTQSNLLLRFMPIQFNQPLD